VNCLIGVHNWCLRHNSFTWTIYFDPENFVYVIGLHNTQLALEEYLAKAETLKKKSFDSLLGLPPLAPSQHIHQTRQHIWWICLLTCIPACTYFHTSDWIYVVFVWSLQFYTKNARSRWEEHAAHIYFDSDDHPICPSNVLNDIRLHCSLYPKLSISTGHVICLTSAQEQVTSRHSGIVKIMQPKLVGMSQRKHYHRNRINVMQIGLNQRYLGWVISSRGVVTVTTKGVI
jgi:hypothetical protein